MYMRHISFSSFLDKIAVRVLTVDLSDFFVLCCCLLLGLVKKEKELGTGCRLLRVRAYEMYYLYWYVDGTGGKIIGINQ